MNNDDFERAFGISSQALTTLVKLAKQVKHQGGKKEDITLLDNEQVLQRVARVIARAGRLTRPFRINFIGGVDNWIDVQFMKLPINKISELESFVEELGCRLATESELRDLYIKNPEIFFDETDYDIGLCIIGTKVTRPHRASEEVVHYHYELTKKGIAEKPFFTNVEDIGKEYTFAVVYK